MGDRVGEVRVYSVFVIFYYSLKDLRKFMKYCLFFIIIVKNLGCDRFVWIIDYYYFGCILEFLGYLILVVECYKLFIKVLNEVIFF